MTKKERVLAAAQLKHVDRIPATFRSSKKLAEKLMRHFGFENPADFALNQKAFLRKLKADFWASGTKVDRFSTFLPRYTGPAPEPPYIDDGTYFYTIGIRSKLGKMGAYDIEYPVLGVDPPLANVSSPADIPKGFLTEKLGLFDFSDMRGRYRSARAQEIAESDDDIVCVGTLSSLFMICSYLRGMENFLVDLAFDKGIAERLVGEVGEFCLEFNRRELEGIGSSAVYYGTWDDVAGQDSMLFSPELFKRHFLPIYRKLIENTKARGLFFGWHCCGSVHEVLPMMIDAGMDVFDVVQTSAKDMDIENVYRLYGKHVCLHGALDVQKLLVNGTPHDVREEVRKIRELWGERGGIILGPSHETLPDAPLENVLAIYEAIVGN